jgi:hypothetical protein
LKPYRSNVLFGVLLLVATVGGYSGGPHNPSSSKSELLGYWAVECSGGEGYVNVTGIGKARLEVNANQIYIETVIKRDVDKFDLFLKEPADLGRGGMQLNWSNFSKEHPVAEIYLVSSEQMKLTWLGFYDVKSQSYRWVQESSLRMEEVTLLKKCQF